MKVKDVMLCELNAINSETVDKSQKLDFATMLGHPRIKRDLIIKLESDIFDSIKNEGELETKHNDIDSYLAELEEKITIVEEYFKKTSQSPVIPKQNSHTLMSHPPSNVTKPAKIDHLITKNHRFVACLLHHNLITIYTTATKSSSLLQNLMGFLLQLTEMR